MYNLIESCQFGVICSVPFELFCMCALIACCLEVAWPCSQSNIVVSPIFETVYNPEKMNVVSCPYHVCSYKIIIN